MRRAYALLPHIKITDLLLEVDRWTGFSKHFTHLKTGEPAKDQILLLPAILADGINLGLSKMEEACPGTAANPVCSRFASPIFRLRTLNSGWGSDTIVLQLQIDCT
jgi:Tn3 transposase DDE domain